MSKISVVVIEDHELSRIGLCAALRQYKNIEILGDAPNASLGLEIIKTHKPDVALVDIGLPDKDGIELTQELKQFQAKLENLQDTYTKVLILTMHKDEDAVIAAFAAGADSYSVKDASVESLVQAIETTNEGNSWIDPTIARVVLKQSRQSQSNSSNSQFQANPINKTESEEYEKLLETYPLTDREMDVLELIVAGCSNAEISEKLYITVGTVKTHVRNILGKLCASDRTQAAVRALRSGLVN